VDEALMRRVQTSAALWDIAGVPLDKRSTGGQKRTRARRVAARASGSR
jgi:hypothetical protein